MVAAEVRRLSQGTAEAARDVKRLLASSQQAIGSGAALATRVGDSVEGVVRSVYVAASIGKVALSTRSQGAEISAVNVALARVSEATQQNSTLVEQSTGASHQLREQAEALSSLISRFVLPGGPREQVLRLRAWIGAVVGS